MSIRVEHLTKAYGTQLAIDDVSFEVNRGQIVGFIGPNGAGKSTTIRIITGVLTPDKGNVFINNINIHDDPVNIRNIIGYLPENNPLYMEMYVKEYLDYVAGHYQGTGNRKENIRKIIRETGLEPEAHKKILALSKGYRQRVGLAQALIHDPEVLIMDEPTSGLDPNQIVEIRNLISRLGKEKTLILSTHIMQEVEAICDRVIIINRGKIVADGKPGEIDSSGGTEPKNTILVEFDRDPDLDTLRSLDGVLQIKSTSGKEILVESDSVTDLRSGIFEFAVKNELKVLSMQKKEKSLEEVFRELTKEK